MARLRRGRTGRGLLVATAGVALVLLLASCGSPSSSQGGTLSAWALYPNVGDLHPGAQVQLADIPIGKVSSISLDGTEAKVTMVFSRSARVSADVTAEARRTSILGQRFVELVPGSSSSSAGGSSIAGRGRRGGGGPLLANGAQIVHAVSIPGIQQLAQAGAEVFGAVAPSQLSALVAAGAEGFGGETAQLRALLDGFNSTLGAYASHTATIRSVITSIDQLSSALAPSAQANAQALTNLAQTTAILSQESDRFENLLQALDNLSVQGNSLLTSYLPQMTTQFQTLAGVTGAIASEQHSLGLVLHWMAPMNYAVSTAQVHHFIQLVDNIIVCGIPGGGSRPTPARECLGGG